MWKFISSWLGFSRRAVTWQLSWYQNSHQNLILTLQEVLDLLASACEGSHWLLATPPPPQTVLRWASFSGSEKVTLENMLVYYYTQKSKINHRRCLWNCWEKDGTTFLILSASFLISPSSPSKPIESFSWRVHALLREGPCFLWFQRPLPLSWCSIFS